MKRFLLLFISFGLYLSLYADDRQLSKLHYWFDDNLSTMTEQTLSGTQQGFNKAIDASSLKEGMHTLYFRIGDNEGQWTPLQVSSFFVAPLRDKGAKAIKAVEYWLDNKTTERKTTEMNGNIWQQTLDVSKLSEGIHTLNYRFVDNYGDYSPVSQSMFFKTQQRAIKVTKLRYWWGQRIDLAQEVSVDAAEYTFEEILSVPKYARDDASTALGVANLRVIAFDDQGRQSAPFCMDIIYGKGPMVLPSTFEATTGTNINFNWLYSDDAGVKDYNVYYSKDGGPFVLWKHSITTTSASFTGEPGTYLIVVTARNNAGQRTSLDREWGVEVKFNPSTE